MEVELNLLQSSQGLLVFLSVSIFSNQVASVEFSQSELQSSSSQDVNSSIDQSPIALDSVDPSYLENMDNDEDAMVDNINFEEDLNEVTEIIQVTTQKQTPLLAFVAAFFVTIATVLGTGLTSPSFILAY